MQGFFFFFKERGKLHLFAKLHNLILILILFHSDCSFFFPKASPHSTGFVLSLHCLKDFRLPLMLEGENKSCRMGRSLWKKKEQSEWKRIRIRIRLCSLANKWSFPLSLKKKKKIPVTYFSQKENNLIQAKKTVV